MPQSGFWFPVMLAKPWPTEATAFANKFTSVPPKFSTRTQEPYSSLLFSLLPLKGQNSLQTGITSNVFFFPDRCQYVVPEAGVEPA
jgi:hypothetical protein